MQLLVFYLSDNRRHYTFPHFVNMINKSLKKPLWKLLILTHSYDSDFYKTHLQNYDINHEIIFIEPCNNYLNKVNFACNYAECNNIPYLMKCDNDIFIKSQTLDYIIDNSHLLENEKHLTLGPVLTSGIPGIEYFKKQFLHENAENKIDELFLQSIFRNGLGADYTPLHKYTLDSIEWNKDDFFEGVKYIDHYYKGIHPIRVNDESILFLNNYILDNKERFLQDNDLSIIYDDNSPYLCNSIFCIKRETYKNILKDQSLFVDQFDEVPLNKFAWKNGMNHLFVKNGFAIHMYYNWNENHLQKEIEFCNKFFN
jgi:hypothetical protein